MVFAARTVLFGGTRFTPQETQFIRATIRAGFTRDQTRVFVREQFQRGISNDAFAGFRTSIDQSELAGLRMIGLRAGDRLNAEAFTNVRVISPTARLVIGTTVRVRFPRTGTFRDLVIRVGFDTMPDESTFRQRVAEIINRGHQGESRVEIEDELRDEDHPRTVTFQDAIEFGEI